MAYAKISFTGVHKGRVQIVLSLYLDETDPNYDKTYIQVIDTESDEFKAGYQGEVDAEGIPVDEADYQKWWDSLPLVWRSNPFHNHVIYCDKDTPDETIKGKIEEDLN